MSRIPWYSETSMLEFHFFKTSSFAGCPSQDLLLIVDATNNGTGQGNTGFSTWGYIREELDKFIKSLNIGPRNIRIGIITYGAMPLKYGFSGSETVVSARLTTAPSQAGRADLKQALVLAFEMFPATRPDGGNHGNTAVILGDASLITNDVITLATLLGRGKNVLVIMVALNPSNNEDVSLRTTLGDIEKVIYNPYTSVTAFFRNTGPLRAQVCNASTPGTPSPPSPSPPSPSPPPGPNNRGKPPIYLVEFHRYFM